MSEVEKLRAEVERLRGIVQRAYYFNGTQTEGGVTRNGYLSPAEWELDEIGVILKEGLPEQDASTDTA